MSEPSPPSYSILCVLPHEEDRLLLRETLCDYRVVFAGTAFHALRDFHSRPFDAYIIDYFIPDWTGVALCSAIRELDPHAPVIFCLSATQERDGVRAMRAGATAYLVKPLEPRLLLPKVSASLEISQMDNINAMIEAQRAARQELERLWKDVQAHIETANAMLASSIERTARSRAYRAFIDARGTRGCFESMWPEMFRNALEDRREK